MPIETAIEPALTAPDAPVSRRIAGALRVLLLEDNPNDAELVTHALRKLDAPANVQRVDTRAAFEHALEEFGPDIVLLDYKLPTFDGATALQIVRRQYPEIPAVMVTGTLGDEAAIELLKAGAKDYVLKDNLVRLVPAVEHALAIEHGIRARKAAEREVQRSELRYRRLFETAQEGILILDGQTGAIVDVNPFLIERLGYAREDLLGKLLWQLGLFKTPEASQQAFNELLARGFVHYNDLKLRCKDGRTLEVEFDANSYEADGLRSYQCNIRDISERRQAERALNDSERRFRGLIENTSDVISVIRADGSISYVSPAIRAVGGYEPAELIGRRLDELIHPDERARAQAMLSTLAKQPGGLLNLDLRLARKDGSFRDTESVARNLLDTPGINGIVVSTRDVTERKLAEQRLSATKKKYRELFESTRDAILTLDPHTASFVAANPAAIKLFGAKDEADLVAHQPWDASPELQADGRTSADKAREMIDIALREGSHFFEWTHRRLDGSEFPADVLLTRVGSNGDTLVYGTVRDVSERRRAEREREFNAAVLSSIQQVSPDGMLLVDPQGRVLSHNQRFLELWAMPPGLVAAGVDAAVVRAGGAHVVDEPGFLARVAQIYADRDCSSHEEIRLKGGRTLERHTMPVKLADGSYLGRAWFFRDVSENRRVQQELQTAHERLRSATEGAAAGVWEADLRTQQMYWDATGRRQYGLSEAEATPDIAAWLSRVHGEDRERLLNTIQTAMRDGSERFEVEFRVPAPDGGLRWLRSFGQIFRDSSGAAQRATGISLDISEAKRTQADKERAEAAVLASEHRFRATIENATDIIAITDAQGLISYISPSVRAVGGYAIEEVAGHRVLDFIDPHAAEDLQKVFAEIVREPGRTERSVRKFRHKDGTLRLFDTVIHNLLDDPAVGGVVLTLRDITEREAAAQELRLFRTLIDRANDAVEVLDSATLRFLDVNQRACTDLGYSRAELLKMSVFDIDPQFTPADLARVEQQLGENGSLLFESLHRRKDGSTFPVEVNVTRFELDRRYQLGIVRDISERKEAEAQLRAITAAAMDAVILMDNDGKLAFWNEAAERIFGYRRAEAIGQDLHTLLAPAQYHDEFRKGFARFRDSGQGAMVGKTAELEALCKDGRRLPVELSLTGVMLKGKWNAVGILRDVSVRKAQEQALRRVNRALKTLSACNSIVVHAQSEAQLLQDMCDTVVSQGGYRVAWVGFAESDAAKSVRPIAAAGADADFVQQLKLSWADTERGDGPTGRCIRSGMPQAVRDIAADPLMAPWREAFRARGYQSALSMPLLGPAGVFGALVIYSDDRDAFDADELTLLSEMAGDLSYGLTALRTAAAHAHGLLKLERSMEGTVQALASTVETRDPYTAGHQRRVAALAKAMARELGYDEQQARGVELAGTILDIGKINVPAEILSKPAVLSALEFELVKVHAEGGFEIIKDVEFPWPVAQMILQHHERLDGSGYPRGLKDAQILPAAKILAVADVVEAMSSHRPHRHGKGIDATLEELVQNRGTLFDPAAVDACVKLFRERGFKFPD